MAHAPTVVPSSFPFSWSYARRGGLNGVLFLVFAFSVLTAQARAQQDCSHWLAGANIPGGFPGASVMWDPDGAGPAGPALVVGGEFLESNSGVSMWTGTSWQPIGQLRSPRALIVFNGDLVAGVTPSGSALRSVVRWDGSAWQPLSQGLNGPVSAFAIYEDELYAGGNFTAVVADSSQAFSIARWDGTAWHAVAGGLKYFYDEGPDDWFTGYVYELTVHDGILVAGGEFNWAGGIQDANSVAGYDGSGWRRYGEGLEEPWFQEETRPGVVFALQVFDGDLYAGGIFTLADGLPRHHLARWEGNTWAAVREGSDPDGVSLSVGDAIEVGVDDLAVYDDELIIAGHFDRAGGEPVSHMARWDGVEWQPPLGAFTSRGPILYEDGTFGFVNYNDPPIIGSLLVSDGTLIATGQFETVNGAVALSIAAWNGTSWSRFGSGTDGPILGLTTFGGELIAAGPFRMIEGESISNIARWDGTQWQTLGLGFDGQCRVLYVDNDKLYVGGNFSVEVAPGVVANNIASWNGTSWQTVGSGTNGPVYAMCRFGSHLIVSGAFDVAGGVNVDSQGIAKVDTGTNTWSALAHGDSAISGASPALAEYQNNLIAFVYGESAANDPIGGIGRWDGSSWTPFSLDPDYRVPDGFLYAMKVHNNNVYIAGYFQYLVGGSGSGVLANNVARWDSFVGTWEPMGGDPDFPGVHGDDPNDLFEFVTSMTIYDDKLIVGGSFSFAGGNPAMGVAAWDGTSWSALGDGIPWGVYSLHAHQQQLFAGGDFFYAGDQVSAYLARWETMECCPADFNQDGFIDPDDLSDFITCFFLEVGTPGSCEDADFNEDGFVDPDDLSDFTTAFFLGCD